MLFFIAGLNYGDRAALSAVFPLLRSDLRLSDLELAATGSLFLWAYAIGSPLAGGLADRVSRSRMVVISLAVWSLITLGTGWVASSSQLMTTRVLLGVAECAYLPAAVALIADHHAAKSRATAMGIHLAGLNLGLVAGGAIAGYLGEHFGWRFGFLLLGGFGLFLAGIAHFILVDPASGRPVVSEGSRSPTAAFGVLLSVPSYWIVVGQAMVISIGTWIFINWLPLYFRETFQLSLTGAGFSGTFMLQSAAVLGIMGGGYLSDRISGIHLERRMLFQAICYLIAAPFLLAFLQRPGYALISVCIFGFSLFRALGASNEHAILCDLLPGDLRSTAVGVMNSANCAAGGAGILLAGYLKQAFGLGEIFAAVSGIMLFAGLLVLTGYRFLLPRDLQRRSHFIQQQETRWDSSPQTLPPSPISRKTGM